MRVAILTTDNREHLRQYERTEPFFGTAPEALLQGFVYLPGVEVHVVSCTQRPMTSPSKLADNIWFHSLLVPKIGWLRTGYQGCIRAVRRKLKEIQPDIVHGQGTERDCAVSAVFSGFPNVLTIHGNMKAMADFDHARPGTFLWLSAKLETLSLGKTAGVLCNSAHTEALVGPRARRVWQVPNSLRMKFFDSPPDRHPIDCPVLLNVGTLLPNKRQVEVLNMARNLWHRGLRFEMQFAGAVESKTKYGKAFMGQLGEAEKAGYARHLGLLSVEKLIAAMDAASALIHVPMEEAFGLVVAEALARNLKFFGAITGGIVDITAGVEGAELFPQGDWPGLENSIAHWIEMRCPCPTEAAETMGRRYHPTVIAHHHIEIYRELLETRS